MENHLSPSILAADFGNLSQNLQAAEEGGARYFHFDIMDGSFVPNISFGMPVIHSLRKNSKAFFDVHMMVDDPDRYVQAVAEAGADGITVHQEACTHLDRTLNHIHECGLKAGVALNPATPISTLSCVLPLVDLVLIMSVNPGFGGQKLIPYTLDKIRALRDYRENAKLHFSIGIDGGATTENVQEIIDCGANFIIAGSAVFRPNDQIAANVKAFRKIMGEKPEGENKS